MEAEWSQVMEEQQPSSPGVNPIDVRECIEQLLKYTLESHLNGTLEFDIGLSKEFCSNLFKDHYLISHTTDSSTVPPKPLYKCLALALYESLAGTNNKIAIFNNSIDLKQKEVWNQLLLDKGSDLADILKTVNFELHVQEPFFTQLKDGLKTVEGRCAVGDYKRIGSGALVLFNKCVVLEVQEVHNYASFLEMLEAESLQKVLPGVKTIEEGVQVYRKFYTEEKERSNGVLAICVAKSAAQPYISMADMLSGLGSEGIQSLLELNVN